MSRSVTISSIAGFSLSGTTAQIIAKVSDGATIEFTLSEPVDSSEVESAVKLSFNGAGAIDDMGQPVPAFENQAVTNNSTNHAVTVQAAEVPSNNSKRLTVVMTGAVSMTTSAGFSITGQQTFDLSACSYSISDGTITFTLSSDVYSGKSMSVVYDGTGTLKAANSDTIHAFSRMITNNSNFVPGFEAGTSARNLAIVLLGHDPASAAEVTQVVTMIHNTVAAGNVNNFVIGDYFALASVNIAAGNDAGGAFSASLADITGHGRNLDFVLVSKNPYKNKNGNTFDHVIFQSRNVLSAMTSYYEGGHYMNPSDTNVGGYAQSKGRAFVTTQVKAALQTAGIPFNDSGIIPLLTRYVANGGSGGTGRDAITDQIFLPTEYEMFGSNTYSSSSGNTAETSDTQTHWSFYADAVSRIKYKADAVAVHWWEASSYASNTGNFCMVHINGIAVLNGASTELGIAPAFPIR
jgi:hypothetical protein